MAVRLAAAFSIAVIALQGCDTTTTASSATPPPVTEQEISNSDGWMSRCKSKVGIDGEIATETQKRALEKCLSDDVQ